MASSNKIRVVLLASEWGSKLDELSSFNRELAMQLAKHPDVQVFVFLPRCDQDEKNAALRHNITLVQATRRPGFHDETHWLCCPPKDLQIDFVIGHGVELGRQAQIIQENRNCKWIQFVHSDPEEQGMFKDCSDAISKGEKKHQDEVDLCVKANLVVAVGTKLAEAYRSYLQFWEKDQNMFVLTPGIFSEFWNIPQCKQDGRCRVLAFGHGNAEDFSLKGLDIAAKAVAKLNDAHLIFVGARKQDELAGRLKEYDIPPSRLRVRSFTEVREQLEKQFSEMVLAIMPSRTEGFGLTALEAMSAGLPVLVSANSGFGEALRKVTFGSQYVIDSEDAAVWAEEIKKVWTKSREIRLEESKTVRHSYVTKYNWEEQCRDLVEKMRCIVNESPRSGATIPEVGEQQPDEDLLGSVNQPHLPQPAIEERSVSRSNEEDTVTLRTRNVKRSDQRKLQSESTSDQGTDVSFQYDI